MQAWVVAPDPDEHALLGFVLQRVGLRVARAESAEEIVERWPRQPGDLVLLAARPPRERDVSQVRAVSKAPIVLVAGRLGEDAQIAFLDAGTDLVVMRPYSSRILLAQLRALLRRAEGVPVFHLPTLQVAGLSLDPASRMVRLDAQGERQERRAQRLTPLEFRLLYTLMIHRGQVLPTDTIVEQVWGYEGEGHRDLVRGLVKRLRAKVEDDPSQPGRVRTIPGVGYGLDVEP